VIVPTEPSTLPMACGISVLCALLTSPEALTTSEVDARVSSCMDSRGRFDDMALQVDVEELWGRMGVPGVELVVSGLPGSSALPEGFAIMAKQARELGGGLPGSSVGIVMAKGGDVFALALPNEAGRPAQLFDTQTRFASSRPVLHQGTLLDILTFLESTFPPSPRADEGGGGEGEEDSILSSVYASFEFSLFVSIPTM
jgi:hypothetical protein